MEKEEKKGRDKVNAYKWERENKIIFSVGLMKTTDRDIIDYLDNETKKGNSRNSIVKQALREKIEKEQENQN